MQRKFILCFVSALLLYSCAIVPRTVPPEKLTSIKNVGVISLMGDELNLTHIGFTVFGNSDSSHSIEDWGIDQHVASVIGDTLRKNGSYAVKEVNYDYSALAKVYTDKVYSPLNFKLIENELRALAQSHAIDTFLVITERRLEDPIGKRSVYYEGMGLYSMGIGETLVKVAPYIWYSLTVVDGKTAQPIADIAGLMTRKRPEFLEPGYSVPYEEVEHSWWNEDFNAMSKSQQQQLEEKLKQLLNESLPYTLQDAKLINNNLQN